MKPLQGINEILQPYGVFIFKLVCSIRFEAKLSYLFFNVSAFPSTGGVTPHERPFFENLFEKKEATPLKTAEVVTNSWKDVVTLSASSSSCCSSERSPLRSPILSPVVPTVNIKEERVSSPLPYQEYSPPGIRSQMQQQIQIQTPISSPETRIQHHVVQQQIQTPISSPETRIQHHVQNHVRTF